jgi:hypothetical protein
VTHRMASYWIVVPRGNAELFDLLSAAFRGRSGFSVIKDRRSGDGRPPDAERRSAGIELGPDEIIVAERADRAVRDREDRSIGRRPGPPRVLRRSVHRPGKGGERQAAARKPRAAYRLFTL